MTDAIKRDDLLAAADEMADALIEIERDQKSHLTLGQSLRVALALSRYRGVAAALAKAEG